MLWKADIQVLMVATPFYQHVYNLSKSNFRNGAHPFLPGEYVLVRFSIQLAFL